MAHDPDVVSGFLRTLSLDGPLDPFFVFADWLQERGDPFGELIAFDCKIEQGAALASDREAFLRSRGREICSLLPGELASLSFKRGFIVAASFGDCSNVDGRKLAEQVNDLFWCPAARLVERLSFNGSKLGDARADFLIDEKRRLEKLQVDLQGNLFSLKTVNRLRNALPNADLHSQHPPAPFAGPHREFLRIQARSLDDADD